MSDQRVAGDGPSRPGGPRVVDGRAVAALVAYALVAVIVTWPLLPHAATHLPATYQMVHFDRLHITWVMSHEAHALATSPTSLLDAGVYRPEPRTLFYNTTGFGLLPYFAATFLPTGNPALALNLALLACVTLTAWTLHLVARRWTGDHLAGAVAASAYLASPIWAFGYLSCVPSFAVLQYQPLLVLALAAPASWLASSAALPVLIALQCLTDPLYVAPAILLPIAALAGWRLARPATRADGRRLAWALVLAGLALLPIAAGYLDVVLRNPSLLAQSIWPPRPPVAAGDAIPRWILVAGYVIAWWLNVLIPLVGMALVALGAASAAARWRRLPADRRAAWIHCGGWVAFALWLPSAHLPFLRGIQRGCLVATIALALLAGLAFAEWRERLHARFGPASGALLALVVIGLLFSVPTGPTDLLARHAPLSYPIQPAPPRASPVIDALRAGSGTVLELPTGTPGRDAQALYRAIFHHRPLVNGYGSYYPEGHGRMLAAAAALPADAALRRLQAEAGVTTIVVRAGELDPAGRRAWEAVLGGAPLPGFRVTLAADGTYVFDAAAPATDPEPRDPRAISTRAGGRSGGTRP